MHIDLLKTAMEIVYFFLGTRLEATSGVVQLV